MTLDQLLEQVRTLFSTAKIVVEYDNRPHSWAVAGWFVQLKVDNSRFGTHYGYSDVSFEEAAHMALDRVKEYQERMKQ